MCRPSSSVRSSSFFLLFGFISSNNIRVQKRRQDNEREKEAVLEEVNFTLLFTLLFLSNIYCFRVEEEGRRRKEEEEETKPFFLLID